MKFIRTLREKHQTKREEEIYQMAEDYITVQDFADSLYIAYQGTPLVPVKEEWTSKEIVLELAKVRKNFVNSKLKEQGLLKIAAVL